MSNNDKNRQKCPAFTETMGMNKDLLPNFIAGFYATSHTNVNKYFGARPMTTILTNKLIMSSIHPTGYKLGIFCSTNADNTQNSANRDATMKAFLDVNLDGHLTGYVSCKVLKDVSFGVWGQRDLKRSAIRSVLEWSNDRFNLRSGLSTGTNKSRTTLYTDYMCRLGARWSFGNRLEVKRDADVIGIATAGSRGDIYWWSGVRPHSFGYGGALEYDGDREKVMATVDEAMNASLHYRRRVNDALTVGAVVTADFRHKTAKMTWLHRATLDGGGLEIRGQLDTDGMVIGHFNKTFSSTTLGTSCAVGISTLLNHRTNALGLGVQLTVGTAPQGDN